MTSLLQISQRFVIDEEELLGKGSTGNVYLGFQASNHNQKYAVKVIDFSKITNPVTQYLLSCEIVALTDLSKQNCKHIVKLQSQPIIQPPSIYLVMQLLQGGSLADFIQQNNKGISQIQAIKLFTQILKGYRIIEQERIIHRDIKPDNLIFRKKKRQNDDSKSEKELCFIDFGYCTKQNVPNKPQGYYNVGSPKYMSPQAYKGSKYSQKSDIWAMGVILYEMLHGTTIDAGMNMEQYFDKMEREGLINKKGISEKIWRLLLGMLEYQVGKRLQLRDIMTRIDQISMDGKSRNFSGPISNLNQNQFQILNLNYDSQIVSQNHTRLLPHQKNQNSEIILQKETVINETQIFPINNSKIQEIPIKSPIHISDRFIIDQDQLLGKGSTGNVYLGFDTQNQNKRCAVKAVDLSQVTNSVTQYLLSCEIVALTDLAKIDCKYIVKLFDIIFHHKYCYLVMELLEGGSLADYIRNQTKGINQDEAIRLFKQMFEGYGVIKNLQIIHRDIKPDNLIFRKKKRQNDDSKSEKELCFIDFGYCTKQNVPNKPQGYYNVGSPKYMSPQAYKGSKYSQKSDIWAMGVILYEMLHGTTIDAGMNMEQYFDKMEREGLINKKGISEQIWVLLVGMLSFQDQKRFQYEEIKRRLQKLIAPDIERSKINNYNPHRGLNPQNNHSLFNHYQTPVRYMQDKCLPVFQSFQYTPAIPQLQFQDGQQGNPKQIFQKVNLHSRRSQRSSTQQPSFLHQQYEQKYFAKSHIFPQQQHNQKIIKRIPSVQNIIQTQNVPRTPFKNSSEPKILLMNPSSFFFKGSKLQEIEQERQEKQSENYMKRSLLQGQNSIQKLRKINLEQVYLGNNRNAKVFNLNKVNHSMNGIEMRPGQQMTKNPQILQQSFDGQGFKNERLRQTTGVMQSMIIPSYYEQGLSPKRFQGNNPGQKSVIIKKNMDVRFSFQRNPVAQVRSENIIKDEKMRNGNGQLENKEIRREMSLKKLNESHNRNRNINQVSVVPVQFILNKSNLKQTIDNKDLRSSMLPLNSHNNVSLVQNMNIIAHQNNRMHKHFHIQRDPSKIMVNENQNMFERSLQFQDKKSAQNYFNNSAIIDVKNHQNLQTIKKAFVNNNQPIFVNNVQLNLDSQSNNKKIHNNQIIRLYYGNKVTFVQDKKDVQLRSVIKSDTKNVIQSQFVKTQNNNKDQNKQFEINNIQQSSQKMGHGQYFQMNNMIGGNIQPQGNMQVNINLSQPHVSSNLPTNQNLHINTIQQPTYNINRSMDLQPQKIKEQQSNIPHYQNSNHFLQHQNYNNQLQPLNSHFQSQVHPHHKPQSINSINQSEIMIQKSNQSQIKYQFNNNNNNLQQNQRVFHNANNNLLYKKVEARSGTNFYPINNTFIVNNQEMTEKNSQYNKTHGLNHQYRNQWQSKVMERGIYETHPNIIGKNTNFNQVASVQINQPPVIISSTKMVPSNQIMHQDNRIINSDLKNHPMHFHRYPPELQYMGVQSSNMGQTQIPTSDHNVQKKVGQNSTIRFL